MKTPRLFTIFWEFFKIGGTVFGGPYPQAAVMERRFVEKQWIVTRQFQEGFGLAQALPGPVGPKIALYIGYCVRGRRGALGALAGFVLPAFLMILALSMIYERLGLVPGLDQFFGGLKPAIVTLLLLTGWRLSRPYHRPRVTTLLLILSASACLLRINPAWILLLAALTGWSLARPFSRYFSLLPPDLALPLVWVFLKAGSLIYGGGWTIVPLLEHDVVHRYGWMDAKTFMDGVALGQMTPGPIVMTATFIGYHVAGWAGACATTLAVFLPSALLILFAAPFLIKWKDHPRVAPVVDAVVAAATGLLIGETFLLVPVSFPHGWAWALGGVSAAAIWWKQWDPTLVMVGCGIAGLILFP